MLLVDDQPVIKEGQTKCTGTGVGADDAADLAHQRLGKAEIVHQIGLDGVHLAGADGVTGQRGETGIDAAQLLDLLEEGDVCAGQTVPSSRVTLRGMTSTPSCAASAGRMSDAESVRMRII